MPTISLCNINRLTFLKERDFVLCEVRTEIWTQLKWTSGFGSAFLIQRHKYSPSEVIFYYYCYHR